MNKLLYILLIHIMAVSAITFDIDRKFEANECYTIDKILFTDISVNLMSYGGEITVYIVPKNDCLITEYYECGTRTSIGGKLRYDEFCEYDEPMYIILRTNNIFFESDVMGYIELIEKEDSILYSWNLYTVIGISILIILIIGFIILYFVRKLCRKKQKSSYDDEAISIGLIEKI